MKYKIRYTDGRNYEDDLSEKVTFTTRKSSQKNVVLEVSSHNTRRLKLSCTNNEANAIAHALLAATLTDFTTNMIIEP